MSTSTYYSSSSLLRFGLLSTLFVSNITCFSSPVITQYLQQQSNCIISIATPTTTTHLYSHVENNNQNDNNVKKQEQKQSSSSLTSLKRKDIYNYILKPVASTALLSSFTINKAVAGGTEVPSKSYPIQKTDEEWAEMLSSKQYDILRKGGTERPYSSILEKETRNGIYKCAGCQAPLFLSKDKFKSGTGWPSFASCIDDGVEIDNVSDFRMNLVGAELRCKNCGGHLGDVFNDGYLFVGTPAFKTGKRFCIDGYALIFYTKFGLEEVRGDNNA